MTEIDVINAYEKELVDWCRRFGRGLEWPDRLEIAKVGLLCAVRTYRKGLSAFLPYAEECVYNILKRERIRKNRIDRIESRFSLDISVDGEDGSAIGQLYYGTGDFVNGVVFCDFMEKLSEDIRSVAWLLVDRFTAEEIMSIRCLSREEFSFYIMQIKYEWEEYNCEIA